ncbi:glyoxylate reductase hydroxypyruvate reductase-like [Pelobates cultripes]|uniref:Glyoxylate reductase/hydroxypyruvate reductase n=1 Tax=Pelobates cultripes TaxID=61616 RepID=A0AAD1S012_PELCU|nr:glyoxylate reductase hydroxypyruvate reductase-like [Pelobates cultripes]
MESNGSLPGVLIQEIGVQCGVLEEHVDYLQKQFTVIPMKEFLEKKQELAEKISCIYVWGCMPKVDYHLLHSLPNLKIVANGGVGIDHLDLKLISSFGVKVTNTPNAVSNATADMAMMMLLASARNLLQGYQVAVSPETKCFPFNWYAEEVTGATLGIVGMGRIGYKIAQRARGFEMKILYYNRNRRIKDEKSVDASYCENLSDLLQQSDFVVLVVPLTKDTKKMIGKKELQQMKPSATLVNICRGGVVDHDALVEALKHGEIKAAALDVTDPEPLPRDHPLLKLHNVILTPHMGSSTQATQRLMMKDMIQSMNDAIAGRPVFNEVIAN